MSNGLQRRLVLGGYQDALEPSFLALVQQARAEDALRPLGVVVTSSAARRRLQHLLVQETGGCLNIEFWNLEQLAAKLGEPLLNSQGRTIISGLAQRLLIEDAVQESLAERDKQFYFRGIADLPRFADAVMRSVADLKEARIELPHFQQVVGDANLGDAAVHKLCDLAIMWAKYEQRLQAEGLADSADVMQAAALNEAGLRALAAFCPLIVYGFYDFNELQKGLLEAVMAQVETWALTPWFGGECETYVDATIAWFEMNGFERTEPPARAESPPGDLTRLKRKLFQPLEPYDENEACRQVAILACPGPRGEVREAMRRILEWAEQSPDVTFDDVMFVARNAAQYAGDVRDVCQTLGLTARVRAGLSLADTHDGAALLLLLEAALGEFTRQSLLELAAAMPLDATALGSTSGPARTALWDELTVRAEVTHGMEQCERALAKLHDGMSAAAQAAQEDDAQDGRSVSRTKLRSLEQLREFVCHLRELGAALQQADTWSEATEHLLRTFMRLRRTAGGPPAICAVRRPLSALDSMGVAYAPSRLAAACAQALRETPWRPPEDAEGPIVSDVMSARGVNYRCLVLLGAGERKFPGVIREDPVLLDHERKHLNQLLEGSGFGGRLPERRRRAQEEVLLWRLTVEAAEEKLLITYPRLQPADGRELIPSHFVLRTVEALSGHTADFQSLAASPWHERIPLGVAPIEEMNGALDKHERDLWLLRRSLGRRAKGRPVPALMETNPLLRQSLRSEAARWGQRRFTPYDGMCDDSSLRQAVEHACRVFDEAVSASRLDDVRSCPYRFLLGRVFRLEPLSDTDPLAGFDNLQIGNLAHRALQRLYADDNLLRSPTMDQLEPAVGAALEAVLDEMAAEDESTFSLLREALKRDLTATLSEYVHRDRNDDAEWEPIRFELVCGYPQCGEDSSDTSTGKDPLEIPLPSGRTIKLCGRIDRIDRHRCEGTYRIIDYKTGNLAPQSKAVENHPDIQLSIYVELASHELGIARSNIAQSCYHGVYKKKNKGKSLPIVCIPRAPDATELVHLIDVLLDTARSGHFIPLATENSPCSYCDHKLVCGAGKEDLFRRKCSDERVEEFLTTFHRVSEKGLR